MRGGASAAGLPPRAVRADAGAPARTFRVRGDPLRLRGERGDRARSGDGEAGCGGRCGHPGLSVSVQSLSHAGEGDKRAPGGRRPDSVELLGRGVLWAITPHRAGGLRREPTLRSERPRVRAPSRGRGGSGHARLGPGAGVCRHPAGDAGGSGVGARPGRSWGLRAELGAASGRPQPDGNRPGQEGRFQKRGGPWLGILSCSRKPLITPGTKFRFGRRAV